MPRVYRPFFKDRTTGQRVKSPNWYAEWRDAAGKKQRKSIGPNKNEALEYLGKKVEASRRLDLGLADLASAKGKVRPVAAWRQEYADVLEARETSAVYRENTAECLQRIIEQCGWLTWADITADSLLVYIARYKAERGISATTANNNLRAARGFTRWLAHHLQDRDPLAKLPYYPETDRRRSKRILTDADLTKIVVAAEQGPRLARMSGKQRAMLYRVAAYTGLRAGELATLTVGHFDLAVSPPTVTVSAADAKGQREEPIPLPGHLAKLLRPYLAKIKRAALLWPNVNPKKFTAALQSDIRRAGVPLLDAAGRKTTFHGLRRGYVVRIIRAGAKVHEVRRLARHVDVATTLDYYTDESLADLGAIVDRA